ncbi:hypothetical protein QVD17_39198 [Tagetes erecta]|uniref:TF-B3 domain-containing protein n=1 Tax=Tagetes erecta TaxID=13708 RepID=A0AAD8JQ78_TARER|nr:hypothetical protein QVD17_39198 [Tagetes erecta]
MTVDSKIFPVKLFRNNEGQVFIRDGWAKVARVMDLQQKDIIVFKLITNTMFRIFIYKHENSTCGSSMAVVILKPSQPFILLNADFLHNCYGDNVPEQIVTIHGDEVSPRCWNVKLCRQGDKYSFNDGWFKLSKDIHLEYAYFIVFSQLTRVSFQVTLYAQNGTQLVIPKHEYNNIEIQSSGNRQHLNHQEFNGKEGGIPKHVYATEPDLIEFTTTANKPLRLPTNVAKAAKLHDELMPIKMRYLSKKTYMVGVRPELSNKTTRFALTGWTDFLLSNRIRKGDKIY